MITFFTLGYCQNVSHALAGGQEFLIFYYDFYAFSFRLLVIPLRYSTFVW